MPWHRDIYSETEIHFSNGPDSCSDPGCKEYTVACCWYHITDSIDQHVDLDRVRYCSGASSTTFLQSWANRILTNVNASSTFIRKALLS